MLQVVSLFLLLLATLFLQKVIPINNCFTTSKENAIESEQHQSNEIVDTCAVEYFEENDYEKQEANPRAANKNAVISLENKGNDLRESNINGIENNNASSEDENTNTFLMGVLPALTASILSGFAAALTQRTLQRENRNPLLFNVELSIFSSMFILVGLLTPSRDVSGHGYFATIRIGSSDFHRLLREGVTAGWTCQTWVPILNNAMGAIFVGMVTKYSGSVTKGFANILGILFSGILNQVVLKTSLSLQELVGGSIAIFSLWLHITNPPS
mmetsp:Transcript_7363/g.11649  ORF Transcript_7363/g.11649 Transcript_7363/m.11649 type:complete len:271 (-) Transcript_7363:59-871(-)